jgi:hypothetical protein
MVEGLDLLGLFLAGSGHGGKVRYYWGYSWLGLVMVEGLVIIEVIPGWVWLWWKG